jgi:predicted amidohydrolase YtcJ
MIDFSLLGVLRASSAYSALSRLFTGGIVMPGVRLLLLFGLAGSVLTSPVLAQSAPADLVLLNGKIVTVDPRFCIAEAVAVAGNRIVAVGKSSDLRPLAAPSARIVDLAGKTVIPGLIDEHAHYARAAQLWSREARLDGVRSRQVAIERLQERARDLPTGAWVLVLGGWSESQFADNPAPFTRDELDRAVPDHPVYAQVNYSHAYANSAALKAAAVDEETTDPKGGKLGRDPGGRLTGALDGPAAYLLVYRKIPALPPAEVPASARGLIADLGRVGVTAVLDAGGFNFSQSFYEPFRALRREGALGIRMFNVVWGDVHTADEVTRWLPEIAKIPVFRGDAMIDTIGYGETIFVPLHDSSNAFEVHPSAEAMAQWRRVAGAVAEAGLHAHIHAQIHGSIAAFLDAIEDIDKTVRPIRPLRWTFVHADQLDARDVVRMRALGMMVSINSRPTVIFDDLVAAQRDKAYDMPPLKLIRDSGLVWGIGTDATVVAPINPFYTLWWLSTGKTMDGRLATHDPVSREEALIAHTRSNAFFLFREAELGSIEPGKLADMVVLDRGYLTVPVDEIRDIAPVMTVMDGRVVYEAR